MEKLEPNKPPKKEKTAEKLGAIRLDYCPDPATKMNRKTKTKMVICPKRRSITQSLSLTNVLPMRDNSPYKYINPMLDTGSPTSREGTKEVSAICQILGIELDLSPPAAIYAHGLGGRMQPYS